MFDTLKYAKGLEAVGVPREQAEAQALMFSEFVEDALATKQDLKVTSDCLLGEMVSLRTGLRTEMQDLKAEIRSEMQELKTELQSEMQELKTELRGEMKSLGTELRTEMLELRNEMQKLEYRLVIKLGTIVTLSIGAFATFVALFVRAG